jgi:hypothetical protein
VNPARISIFGEAVEMYYRAYVIIHHDLALRNVTSEIHATGIALYKVFNVNMTQLGASLTIYIY